jgi:hypothetical protein
MDTNQVLDIWKNSLNDAKVLFNVVDHVKKGDTRADAYAVDAAGPVVGERGKKRRPEAQMNLVSFVQTASICQSITYHSGSSADTTLRALHVVRISSSPLASTAVLVRSRRFREHVGPGTGPAP